MSYLVTLKDEYKEWQETFETEKELLDELEVKCLKTEVVSIRKVGSEEKRG